MVDKVLAVHEKVDLKRALRESREQQRASEKPSCLGKGTSLAIPLALEELLKSHLADLVEKAREDTCMEMEQDAQIEAFDKIKENVG
ncbi:hypothetical protein R1flu_007339 [Riccia fluitans]|uniref:Uncharacterized protein n=1 Tax=Riccia fluitans TaxID=41844 RepID=A0ABD1YZE4_9MARC